MTRLSRQQSMQTHLLIAAIAALSVPVAAAQGSARVDSVLTALAQEGMAGVVRIERNGQVIFEKAYGLADRAHGIPLTPGTVVQIGSNTKDITTVAILELVEAGRLTLTDSLGRFFPAVPADKRGITITHLLDHTAGLPAAVGDDFEPLEREAFIARALRTPLLAAPGTREVYSNTGFSILAAIIEQRSGMPYEAFIRTNVLQPIGLDHTGLVLPRFDSLTVAHGYRADGTDNGTMLSKPHAPDGSWWNLRGNGGLLSTVGEMAKFYRALLDGDRLLKPATRALRFNPLEPMGLAGSDGVSSFDYERFPRLGVVVLLATTTESVPMPRVRRAVLRALGLNGA